jgi:hypothetical protein
MNSRVNRQRATAAGVPCAQTCRCLSPARKSLNRSAGLVRHQRLRSDLHMGTSRNSKRIYRRSELAREPVDDETPCSRAPDKSPGTSKLAPTGEISIFRSGHTAFTGE